MATNVLAPSPEQKSFSPRRILGFFLTPKSTNRDEAFRERTIRYTITILGVLVGLSLFISVVLFNDFRNGVQWDTPPVLNMICLAFCICSAVAISQKRIGLAGVFLVLLI